MSQIFQKHCSQCFHVLSDDTRLRILKELQREAVNVEHITHVIGVSQPTVSYHLKLLDAIGLVAKEKRGRETLYSFNKNYPCKGCGVFTAPIKIAS